MEVIQLFKIMKNSRFYYSMPTVTREVEMVDGVGYDPFAIIRMSKAKTPCRRITICSTLNKENQTLSFGVAVCSPGDKFVREEGRRIAYERAINNPIRVVPVTKENIREIRFQNCWDLEQEVFNMNPKNF